MGGAADLLVATIMVVLVYIHDRLRCLVLSLRILKRMRWLFLSILLIYFWFTPGRPVFSPLSVPWTPTVEGVQIGLMRVLSLLLIVLTVNYLLSRVPRTQLISSILWILYPLRHIGLPYQRIAVRSALTLELLGEVQTELLESVAEQRKNKAVDARAKPNRESSSLLAKLNAIGVSASQIITAVLLKADQMPVQTLEIPRRSRPPYVQWIYPVLISAVFVLLHTVVLRP